MQTGQYSSIIWFAVLIGVFYFLLIRPQQQRAREHRRLISELQVGDRVVTIGGIHGTVKSISDDTVSLQVTADVCMTFSKDAVARRAGGK
ncbi:MAG TPA: preprotein translocase subunit YajC [Actinobacteria bacterium]|nr:preprotein translocase subunit YajC [Actinomycetota bacterium]